MTKKIWCVFVPHSVYQISVMQRRLKSGDDQEKKLTCGFLHNYELSSEITSIDKCNFIYRVLYKECF